MLRFFIWGIVWAVILGVIWLPLGLILGGFLVLSLFAMPGIKEDERRYARMRLINLGNLEARSPEEERRIREEMRRMAKVLE